MLARGYSLIECIVVLTIIAIITALGYPALRHYSERSQDQAIQQTLIQAIRFAAQTASARELPVGLYRKSDNEFIVFIDHHHNGSISDEAQVLQKFNINLHGGTLAWRAYPYYHHYVLFSAESDNGTFWYCRAKDKRPAWLVTVTRSAETQIKYPDKEGVMRDSRGREFRC